MSADEQITAEVAIDALPLVLPQPIGGRRIVLLQAANDSDIWQLDYAAVGTESRYLSVDVEDDLDNSYTSTGGWSSSDPNLVHGSYTFEPRLNDQARSLKVVFSLEENAEASTVDGRLSPALVARHWVDRLEGQLRGWTRRQEVVDIVLNASTRLEAKDRLVEPPLGLLDGDAEAILDLPLRRFTADGERELRNELVQAVGALEAGTTS